MDDYYDEDGKIRPEVEDALDDLMNGCRRPDIRLEEKIQRLATKPEKPPEAPQAIAIRIGDEWDRHISDIRERSFVRHALARHIQVSNWSEVGRLRQKHGI